MNLSSLSKADLILICEELGVEGARHKTKALIIEAIRATGVDAAELSECLELAKDGQREKLEERERSDRIRREELEKQQREIELKKLDLELKKCQTDGGNGAGSGGGDRVSFKMKNLMQPYKVGEDIGLFLVNFERTCEKVAFARQTWPQRLLTLLPCQAADVVARLSKEDAESYDAVKSSLLKRYRLSTEAFRLRFRQAKKGKEESYLEFAYDLKANLIEWLKSAEVFDNHDSVVECICLEQFYRSIPEQTRLWVLDQREVKTTQRAAELAEEYAVRRNLQEEDRYGSVRRDAEPKGYPRKGKFVDGKNLGKKAAPETQSNQGKGRSNEDHQVVKEGTDTKLEQKKAFEAKKPMVCFKCQKPGHIAAGCRAPNVVFSYISENEENMKLLEPYLSDMTVNGRACKVLRDSAATMDVIHPTYVDPNGYTGGCAWIKQVVEEHSVCLPIARVCIEGPFGMLHTEAAVSTNLPLQYPYLFSNRSDQLLRERGLHFSVESVQALTRSKARDLAAKFHYESEGTDLVETGRKEVVDEKTADQAESAHAPLKETDPEIADPGTDASQEVLHPAEEPDPEGIALTPASASFQRLLSVERSTLIAEQEGDRSLQNLKECCHEGVARKNVTFHKRSGVLYRKYQDRKGVEFDQLVVPSRYRRDLLHLSHGSSWSGHLGIKKTKARLLQDYYWPGCFKEVEEFVKTCDACQRVGKPHDKWKAPMKLVPIITEPFRRLVIDTVGPLPATESGYRYILTMLCPATKFPEAVPLRDLSSAAIVDALLSVFARVGFPSEIQSDLGSSFTSALTSTFFKKCGIRVIHSSVSHPQSNSVEKWHSVLKRVLRALCFERKKDWESCLPATMFALRTAPHEATGYSPAELVYGRTLRSPLQMVRETWEDRGEDPTVVEYVLQLLERLHGARRVVEGNMKAAQTRAKAYYDKNARVRGFELKEQVMLLKPSKKNRLEVQWEGPAEVMEKLSDTNYVVRLPGRRKELRIYHTNLMKPYRQREVVVNMTLNAPEEMQLEMPTLGEGSEKIPVDEMMREAVTSGDLQPDQVNELTELVREFSDLFSEIPGRTPLVTHDIELTSDAPIRSKPYRVSPRQREIMDVEVRRMLELGVIEPGESDYTSPLILVEVPGKDPRPCIDYRKLNAITRDQTYPIPNIEERLETVSSAQFISTLDLVRGYWQVPLTERASRYAAFISPLGTFRPLMLSFGLKNAPFCFSSLMDKVLRGLEDFALPYLDDVAVFSLTWEDHVAHLRSVLERIRGACLTVRAKKCQLARGEVAYLGHEIGRGCRRPSELKLAAIEEYPRPLTKTAIRAFLGLTGYYQHYIANYSNIASPLTDALRKTEPQQVLWNDRREQAFCTLKSELMQRPILRAPDYGKAFVIQCDASDRGMGVVLSQTDDSGEEHPVLYASRKLTTREEAYSASEKECACLVWAVQKLACYVAGTRFTIETDHCPLTWLKNMSPKNGRLLRWSLALQQYSFDIKYKRGKLHTNADSLSRCS